MAPPDRVRSKLIQAAPPWSGYIASTNYQMLGPSALSYTQNLIPKSESLTYDYGWSDYEAANGTTNPIPLGGVGWAFPGTTGFPVMSLDFLPGLISSLDEGIVAITAASGGTSGTVFHYPPNIIPQWGILTAAGDAILTDSDQMIDSAFYPFPNTGSQQGILVWSNGGFDTTNARIYYFPSNAGGTQYNNLPTPTARPDLSSGASFNCRSLCVFGERLVVLNTMESGASPNRSQPQQLRWTVPSWTTVTAANWSGRGSGFARMTQFNGAGVAVRTIGDRMAVYMEDGVALLKKTGEYQAPFTLDYATLRRGLLGTKAVCQVGGGIHFGVFTDGFFLFSANGSWEELGTQVQKGTRVRKWTDYFFTILNRQYQHKMVTFYDEERHLVYISFPSVGSTSNNNLWVYEMEADRMWPQDWTRFPTAWCFGRDDAGGQMRPIHGDGSGYVYEHEYDSYLRAGVAPSWQLYIASQDLDDPFSEKAVTGHYLEFKDHNVSGTITLGTYPGTAPASSLSNTAYAALAYTGSTAERKRLWIPTHGSALTMEHKFSGTHPFTIYGLSHEYQRVGDGK
jgi:hypothetical protein